MARKQWAMCAALLALVALPLTADGISATAYGGWPALGFSTALFFVAGRERRLATLAVLTVVISIGLTIGYDVSYLVALPGSLTVTMPALLTAVLLGWGRINPRVRLDLIDDGRYHLVTALAAAACGVLGAIGVLATSGPGDMGLAALMSFLAALSALMVVLPIFIGESTTPPAASHLEMFFQRLVLVLLAGPVLWSESAGALIFVLFTLLGWSARRATPREAHLQLLGVCVVAYVLALAGRGPLVSAPAGIADDLAPGLFYLFAISACYLVVPMTLSVEKMVAINRRASRAATTLERLFDSAVGTVFIALDERGVVTHFNSGAEKALGYPASTIVGIEPTMLFSDAELQRQAEHFGVRATRAEVLFAQARRGERRDWVLVRQDGAPRTLSLSLSHIHDPDGNVVGMIASGEDISDRLRAEQVLAAALERELASVRSLQRVDRVKEDLVSTVSHELRTPITSIAGYAELLADGVLGPLTEKQTDALDRIERNTSRLGTLVEDLLTMSRSETGQLELDRRRLDLRVVAREAFDTLRELGSSRSMELTLRLPDQPVPVEGDRVALSRVAENLLTNAVKFTPDGGCVTLSVQVDSSERCSLTVTDTGMGIPSVDVPHLFDRFFRSSSATNQAIQGSGLGLSIVHAIVSQHGGEVSVDSTVGQGTSFTVRLPARISAAASSVA